MLGRDEACDISLDEQLREPLSEPVHGNAEGWLLVDLNSTNGSFVNGRRVREHRLRDGDLIAVGQYQLRFACADARAARARPRAADDTAMSPKPMIGKSA